MKNLPTKLALLPGILLSAYGVAAVAYLLAISWSIPALDMFGFRQTQTAISAYWIAKGGPLFAYETPVLGYPWSIPFEFPIYQWLVALLANLGGLSIDQSGRVVSVVFFLAATLVVFRVIDRLSSNRAVAWVCAGTFIASPMAIFWARSVMIESTALFFSVAFVYAIVEFHLSQKMRFAFAAALFAILAAVVKVTTFFAFAILVAIALVFRLVRSRTAPQALMRTVRTGFVAGFTVALSILALLSWTGYSDDLKQTTLLGGTVTSSRLTGFNFGTLEQRLDVQSWRSIILGRAIYDVLGSRWILLVSACVLAFSKPLRWMGVVLLVMYVIPMMTFTNLHYVHNYYQFANFAFLTTLVGLAIGSLANRGIVGAFAASLAAIVVAWVSWNALQTEFVPRIAQDQAHSRIIDLARFVRAHTAENQTILIFGMGWSSEVPYYAMRKAVGVPDWIPEENLVALLDHRRAFGEDELGALIICPNALSQPESTIRAEYDRVVRTYADGRARHGVGGCQVYF